MAMTVPFQIGLLLRPSSGWTSSSCGEANVPDSPFYRGQLMRTRQGCVLRRRWPRSGRARAWRRDGRRPHGSSAERPGTESAGRVPCPASVRRTQRWRSSAWFPPCTAGTARGAPAPVTRPATRCAPPRTALGRLPSPVQGPYHGAGATTRPRARGRPQKPLPPGPGLAGIASVTCFGLVRRHWTFSGTPGQGASGLRSG